MNKYRVIIDNSFNKNYNQYNQIKDLLPKHSLFIYIKINSEEQENFEYNIHFDTISERVMQLCPSKYNILLVNDEYITTNIYLRQENYIADKKIILLKDIVDYYICSTKYSFEILKSEYKIKKNKIIYLDTLTNNVYKIYKINLNKQKYILYDIDLYSGHNNLILLQTWMKHFLDRPEKLIILYKYNTDAIIRFNMILHKNGYYKNIILLNDINVLNSNIYASIINTSYYNLITLLYENILKERIVITLENDISNNFDYNLIKIPVFTEQYILSSLTKLFKYSSNEIINITKNNKKLILKNINLTKNKIIKLVGESNFNNNIDIKREFISTKFQTNVPIHAIFHYSEEALKISQRKIAKKIEKIDKMFNKIKDEEITDEYYRILQKPKNITKYAYATLLILNNSYIPTILATGYNLKYIDKTQYNTICFLQDKPYYENGVLKFVGVSQNEIEDIKKIYDCVVGVDLLRVNKNAGFGYHYIVANYYATKIILFGFTMYSKIMYYDATTVIQQNVDYYFTKYKGSKYYNVPDLDIYELTGNLYMFEPKTYYIKKTLYLLENYNNIFVKETLSLSTPDENLEFFTVYPNWIELRIDINEIRNNFFNKTPYIHTGKIKKPYNFNLFVRFKPFLYNFFEKIDNTMFTTNFDYYQVWDLAIKSLIKDFPELYCYFEYIKTFRYTLF